MDEKLICKVDCYAMLPRFATAPTDPAGALVPVPSPLPPTEAKLRK